MSVPEVNRYINAWTKRYTQQRKDALSDMYNLADLVAYSISRLFSEQSRYEPIDVYFPEMFKEEGELRKEHELELSAQRFIQFAQSFNKRFED